MKRAEPARQPVDNTEVYIRPSSLEIATCSVPGFLKPEAPVVPSSLDPIEALETALLPALARPPCLVAFSGGRDSSAVLAAAVRLARREGLPLPVALTRRWPAYPDTDEAEWQELVIRHLGVTDWEPLDFEENDVIGPTCSPSLRRIGVLWPPLAHSWPPMFAKAQGGSFVTGEGGDEVFGDRRCVWLRRALWPNPTKRVVARAALSLAPRPVRRIAGKRRLEREFPTPWLLPRARERLYRTLAEDDAREPLRWGASMRWHLRQRSVAVGSHNFRLLAAESDVVLHEPLLDPGFLGALSSRAQWLGFPGRTRAMQAIFGSLLPEEVLARQTKAYTTSTVFGPWTRKFVREWTGSGVDTTLVDQEALRRTWAAADIPVATLLLVQHSWLALSGVEPAHEKA